MGDSL